jgi:hypothetical protein
MAWYLRTLRQGLKSAEGDLARIASENARLTTENALLRAQLRSRKLVLLEQTAGIRGVRNSLSPSITPPIVG